MLSNMPEYQTFELKCEGCNKLSCYLKTTKEEYDELYSTLCTTIFCKNCIADERECNRCFNEVDMLYRVDGESGYVDFCSIECAESYMSRNLSEFIYKIG